MPRTVEYHCLSCRDHSVTREFDVSHVSLSCGTCGEFGRFLNGDVLAKFEAFEASPPDELDWNRLDRTEKFMIAERIVRHGHTVDDFEVETPDDESAPDDAPAEDQTDDAPTENPADEPPAADQADDAPAEGQADDAPAENPTDEPPAADQAEDDLAEDLTDEPPVEDQTDDRPAEDVVDGGM